MEFNQIGRCSIALQALYLKSFRFDSIRSMVWPEIRHKFGFTYRYFCPGRFLAEAAEGRPLWCGRLPRCVAAVWAD